MLKKKSAASVDASFEAFSRESTTPSGRGTAKMRNANGKAAAAIHFPPRNRKPPAPNKQMKETVVSERKSFWLSSCPKGVIGDAPTAAAAPTMNKITAHPGAGLNC